VQQDLSVEQGLLFISFQKSPQQFVDLHDAMIRGDIQGVPDRLLTGGAVKPLSAEIYFVPDYLEWGYVGQVFFEPDPFERLFAGAKKANNGEFDAAIEQYRNLVRDFPTFLPGITNVADLAPDLEALDFADHYSRLASESEPNHVLTLSVRAWTEYLKGRYFDAAHYARRAIELTYNDYLRGYPYHSLGASLLEAGRYAEGEEALRRSLYRVAGEPLIAFSLGNCLDAQNRHDEADAAYSLCLSIIAWRMQKGQVSGRDRRNLFHMKDIRYRSPRNQRVFARARLMLMRGPGIVSYQL
jgi:tetratricopeptide (TPR) repeat protein